MQITLDTKMIAVLLKNTAVQAGIEKASKDIELPEMDSMYNVLEAIGQQLLSKFEEDKQ